VGVQDSTATSPTAASLPPNSKDLTGSAGAGAGSGAGAGGVLALPRPRVVPGWGLYAAACVGEVVKVRGHRGESVPLTCIPTALQGCTPCPPALLTVAPLLLRCCCHAACTFHCLLTGASRSGGQGQEGIPPAGNGGHSPRGSSVRGLTGSPLVPPLAPPPYATLPSPPPMHSTCLPWACLPS